MANNEEKGKFNGQIRTVLKSIKKQDDNGERFLELCGNFNMTIGATGFPHMICHKISWTSPDSRTQNQTDHIAISRICNYSLLDVRHKRGADVGSDHHLMLAEVRLKITTMQNKMQSSKRRFNVNKLRDGKLNKQFRLELRNGFSLLSCEKEREDE
jgi:hypothetical protein